MTLASLVTPDLDLSNDIDATKTYQVANGKMQGTIDGRAALQQAIAMMLGTERYEYPIYDLDYGLQTADLIGKDPDYVQAELPRRISECLLTDDRVESVDNFTFTVTDDEMLCTFDVGSIYGSISTSKGVAV